MLDCTGQSDGRFDLGQTSSRAAPQGRRCALKALPGGAEIGRHGVRFTVQSGLALVCCTCLLLIQTGHKRGYLLGGTTDRKTYATSQALKVRPIPRREGMSNTNETELTTHSRTEFYFSINRRERHGENLS